MNSLIAADKFDQFRQEVLPPNRSKALFASMPAHVKPERFERNLAIALRQQPKLLECDPLLVFNEVSKAAALGLLLDPQLGEAYLIAANDWKSGKQVPQLRVGYRGLIKLGRQSGEIEMIYSHEVCRNDEFRCVLGDEKSLKHIPNLMEDRGDVGAYYAVVKFKDGATDFEVMPLREIHTIRDRSDGWRAFRAGKIKSTPWSTDEGEMSKKTVIRRLMKRLPQSPDLADALRIEDEADYRDMRDVTPEASGLAARLQQARGGGSLPATTPNSGFSVDSIERELAPISQPATARNASVTGGANTGGDHEAHRVAIHHRQQHEQVESEGAAQTRGGAGSDASVTSPGGEQPGSDFSRPGAANGTAAQQSIQDVEAQALPKAVERDSLSSESGEASASMDDRPPHPNPETSPSTDLAGEQEDEPGTAPPDPQPGSSSAPLMTRDQFRAYSMALARATKKTSLKQFGEQRGGLIKAELGGSPAIGDMAIVKKVFSLHEQRVEGRLDASAISDELEAMLDRHFEGGA